MQFIGLFRQSLNACRKVPKRYDWVNIESAKNDQNKNLYKNWFIVQINNWLILHWLQTQPWWLCSCWWASRARGHVPTTAPSRRRWRVCTTWQMETTPKSASTPLTSYGPSPSASKWGWGLKIWLSSKLNIPLSFHYCLHVTI